MCPAPWALNDATCTKADERHPSVLDPQQSCTFKGLPVASQRPLRRSRGAKHVFPPPRRSAQNLERLIRQQHAMAHSVLRRRDRPPIVVDVGPPHGDHLAHALCREQAKAKQGAPCRVERMPQGSDLRRAQDAFATTLGRWPLNAVTWVGLDQSLPDCPPEQAPGG